MGLLKGFLELFCGQERPKRKLQIRDFFLLKLDRPLFTEAHDNGFLADVSVSFGESLGVCGDLERILVVETRAGLPVQNQKLPVSPAERVQASAVAELTAGPFAVAQATLDAGGLPP